ncbi:MAG: hypothetical protein RIM84_26460 [Alphaproteobacteria bacterium]
MDHARAFQDFSGISIRRVLSAQVSRETSTFSVIAAGVADVARVPFKKVRRPIRPLDEMA